MNNSKTLQNLMNAFAGESQAYQRYMIFAKIAKKEGWANIAAIFEETAINEQQHAKEFYKSIISIVGEDNMPLMHPVTATYPIVKGDTYTNLIEASKGESAEVGDYEEFSNIAKEEGFNDVSTKFALIGKVEAHHSARYTAMANLLKVEELLKREATTEWKCMKCGYIHSGRKAPEICPICGHYHGYFEEYSSFLK